MGKILIVTIRSKGGGAEKIVENLIKSRPSEFVWVNMECILERPFVIRYFIFFLLILKNIKDVKKVIIGTEGVIGLVIYPFKIFTKKKFILWNHCYFQDYKFFLNSKNKIIYSLVYKLYSLRMNASPASVGGLFIPNPYEFTFIEKRNNFTDNQNVTLLSISSLAKLKGVDSSVRLLSTLPSNINLSIYGEGNEKNNLEELSRITNVQNRVNFFGFVTNPFMSSINKASILILNSKTEALPTIILEAIENRIPIIVKYYKGAEYWSGFNTVFVFDNITSENVMDTISYFNKLGNDQYNEIFVSDLKKLEVKHSYDNFIKNVESI